MTSWELVVDGSEVITTDDGLYDIPELRDTFNPFANVGIAVLDDRDGDLYDKFPRGTRVDFRWADEVSDPDTLTVNNSETEAVNDGETETYSEATVGGTVDIGGTLDLGTRDRNERLQGYVVERREVENNGADQLEITVYSLDQLLRGDKVTENTSGLTVFEALDTIIVNDTPVTWVPGNVTVGDNITLSRDLSGERVEDALLYLSFISNNELIRVNDSIEFEFVPVEQTPAPRDIDSTQWFYADVPERGKEVINEVRVWYSDGEEQVTVTNGADKLALQDALGLDDAYSTVKEVSRPDITEFDDAKDLGNQLLEDRTISTPLAVTTFGLETAEPGQVINVNIPSKGVSGDFEIASITYNWATDETELILIEQTGYQDELLVRINDAVERVELRDVNRDADESRVTDTRVESIVDVTGDIEGVSLSDARFTNTARDKLRDGWGGDGAITVAEIAIGDDNTNLSRTNTALGNETSRVSVSETLNGTTGVTYDGAFGGATASEIGLFDSAGDLIARGVVDSEQSDSALTGSISMAVSDNSALERGVFTDSGQESVRDLLADNSPALPNKYAYGTDGTLPTESDTALGNQVVSVGFDEVLVQSAASTEDWNGLVSVADDEPVEVAGGEVRVLESCDQRDALTENDGESGTTIGFQNDDAYNNGQGAVMGVAGQSIRFEFTPAYDIPASRVGIQLRIELDNADADISLYWDNTRFSGFDLTGSTIPLDWEPFGQNTTVGDDTWANAVNEDLQAGETYVLRVDVNDASTLIFDCLAIYDNQYTYNFANPDAGTNGGGYIDGPQSYPDLVEKTFTTAQTRRVVTEATAEQAWNNTDNNQYIALSNDGGSTFIQTDNSDTASATFSSAENDVITKVGLSRYTSSTNQFPATGNAGQAIDTHNLFANVDAINPSGLGVAEVDAVVPQGTITGERLEEAGELTSGDVLLTRAVFAPFDVFASTLVRSSEKVSFDVTR